METCIGYTDRETAFLSTDERWLIHRMRKYIAAHPDKVRIIAQPEENDGCLYMTVPADWLHIYPPARKPMTAENRAAAIQRFAAFRQEKQKRQEAEAWTNI